MQQKRKRNHNKKRFVGPDSVPGETRVLNFSFRYLQEFHVNFPISSCNLEFFNALTKRMKYYGEMAVDQFVQEDYKEHRHPLIWENTNVADGFPNIDPAEIGTDAAWQFCLHGEHEKSHDSWRIHGFLRDTTFFVVWLDAEHYLTLPPDKKKKC